MIKRCLQKRRKKIRDLSYKRGFSWAMSSYFLEGNSLLEMEAAAYTPYYTSGGYDSPESFFDRGVDYALSIIRDYESTQPGKSYSVNR